VNKSFVNQSFLFISIIFIIIASINFIVDPGNIYLNKSLAEKQVHLLSNTLFKSKYGIISNGWNERLVKISLANRSGKFDCIVIGSSRVLQISSIRNTGNIDKQCENLLNLGVSGGSLEDIAIFTNIILSSPNLPNKVFIGIDPWTIKFNMDNRYIAYQKHLDELNKLLQDRNGSSISSSHILSNLFNGEYLYYSIRNIIKFISQNNKINNLFAKEIVAVANSFNFELGYKDKISVILQDGSHVYSKDWIQSQRNTIYTVPYGGGGYKISDKIYNKKALEYFTKIIDLYKLNDISMHFILTPYHPNVFKNGKTKPVKHMNAIEGVVKKLASSKNIKLYGSFFPNKLSCKEDEFFDFMHTTNKCLNKIDFSE
jgi:hypothetical protein